MIKKLNILFVSEFWKPIVKGGGEINVYEIAKALVEKGHSVSVFTSKYGDLEAHEYMDGIEIYRCLDTGNVDSLIGNFKRMFIFKNSLEEYIPQMGQFDVVHMIGTSIVVAEHFMKKPFATIESYTALCPKGDFLYGKEECKHNCVLWRFILCQLKANEVGKMKYSWYLKFNPFFWALIIWRYKQLDNALSHCHIIPISKYVQNRLTWQKQLNYTDIVPNIIDVKKFRDEQQPYRKHKIMKILYLGSLTEYKGVKVLCEAVEETKDVEVHFYGEGLLKEYIKGFKNCSVYEPIDYKKVPFIMSLYDVVVVPSLWSEPFGRIPIEAMAANKLVIASDIGAISEIVGKNGILVPPGNVKALRRAIQKAKKNYKVNIDIKEFDKYIKKQVIFKLEEVYKRGLL